LAKLTLEQAEEWIKKAQNKANQLGVNVSVYVVDDSGIPVAFARMNGAPILGADIARAKAFTAAAFRKNTKDLHEAWKDRQNAASALMEIGGGKVAVITGGVVAMKDGEVLGGIGVSGATSDQDHECAMEALTSA
jgi:uncharacterized protein GlcG (DUF336 family)